MENKHNEQIERKLGVYAQEKGLSVELFVRLTPMPELLILLTENGHVSLRDVLSVMQLKTGKTPTKNSAYLRLWRHGYKAVSSEHTGLFTLKK